MLLRNFFQTNGNIVNTLLKTVANMIDRSKMVNKFMQTGLYSGSGFIPSAINTYEFIPRSGLMASFYMYKENPGFEWASETQNIMKMHAPGRMLVRYYAEVVNTNTTDSTANVYFKVANTAGTDGTFFRAVIADGTTQYVSGILRMDYARDDEIGLMFYTNKTGVYLKRINIEHEQYPPADYYPLTDLV